VFLDGAQPIAFTSEYSIDPAWSPNGDLWSIPQRCRNDLSAARRTADGHPYPLPHHVDAARAGHVPAELPALAILTADRHKKVGLLDLEDR